MSVASSGRTSAPNSSVVSVITSRDESDSEGDMSKSSMVGSSSGVGKVRRRNSRFFSLAVRRDLAPRRQQKMKWYPNKSITSILSPFAKTFVPQVNLLTSANAITIGGSEIMNKNPQLAKMQPPESQNSGVIVFDEIHE